MKARMKSSNKSNFAAFGFTAAVAANASDKLLEDVPVDDPEIVWGRYSMICMNKGDKRFFRDCMKDVHRLTISQSEWRLNAYRCNC